MTIMEKTRHLLSIERECVARQQCDRNCGACDLVQDQDELLQAFDFAISLLNATEPHVLTEEDFTDAFIGARCDKHGRLPVWVEYRTGRCGWDTTSLKTMRIGMYTWGRQNFRYWTGRPTKKQREAVKWNDR